MKIFCIDDDKLVLSSLKMLLEPNEVITFTSAFEGIEYFKKNDCDIVLLDIRMSELNGIEVAKRLRKIKPNCKIVLLSTFIEIDILKDVISEKFNGYLLKTNPDCILQSLESVFQGQVVFHDAILPNLSLSSTIDLSNKLNETEQTILSLIAKGYNNQEIAEELSYSLGTVRNYISNILEILDLRDRTQLVVYYYTGKKY